MLVAVVEPVRKRHARFAANPESLYKGGCLCEGVGTEGKALGLVAVTWKRRGHICPLLDDQ